MFGHKIKIDDGLFEKITAVAASLGCTVEEFVAKALQKEADRVLSKSGRQEASSAEVEEITKKLQGLGYLE